MIHTQFGDGEIVGVEHGRMGKTRYKVAGYGFEMWMDATDPAIITANENLFSYAPEMEAAGYAEHIPGTPMEEPHFGGGHHGGDAWAVHGTRREASGGFGFEPSGDVFDNSTTLPYDWTPQYPVDGFRHEQTISPDHEIDADERMRWTDSRTGEGRDEPDGPGPNPDLFAKKAAHQDEPCGGCGAEAGEECRPMCIGKAAYDDERHTHHEGSLFHESGGIIPLDRFNPDKVDMDSPEYQDAGLLDRRLQDYGPDRVQEDYGFPYDPDTCGHGDEELLGDDTTVRCNDCGNRREIEHQDHGDDPFAHHEAKWERPAGLDDRYASIPDAPDHSEVGRFRQDPYGAIVRKGSMELDAGLDRETGEWIDLVLADRSIRTAAWKDVRKKAVRILRDGGVHVKASDSNAILASVDGDHGTYEVMILNGSAYPNGGFSGGKRAIANWKCGCEWGKWAFKRKFTFVGRLCSHGYATYLAQQSQQAKTNPSHFKKRKGSIVDDFKSWAKDSNDNHVDMTAADNFLSTLEEPATRDQAEKVFGFVQGSDSGCSPSWERDYDQDGYSNNPDDAYKTADVLKHQPHRLTPNLYWVPELSDEQNHYFTDLGDDRETTGPDQIMASRRRIAGYEFGDEWQQCEPIENYARSVSNQAERAGITNPDEALHHFAHDNLDDEHIEMLRDYLHSNGLKSGPSPKNPLLEDGEYPPGGFGGAEDYPNEDRLDHYSSRRQAGGVATGDPRDYMGDPDDWRSRQQGNDWADIVDGYEALPEHEQHRHERKEWSKDARQAGRYDDPTLDLDLPPRRIPEMPRRYDDETDWDAYDHAQDVFENARNNPREYPDPTPDRHLDLLPGMPSRKKKAKGEKAITEHHPAFAWHAEGVEDMPKDGIVHFSSLKMVADEDLLNKLRDLSNEEPSNHFQDCRDHNDEVKGVVDELHERGFDASPLVAMKRAAFWKGAENEDESDASLAANSAPNAPGTPGGQGGPYKDVSPASSVVNNARRPVPTTNAQGQQIIPSGPVQGTHDGNNGTAMDPGSPKASAGGQQDANQKKPAQQAGGGVGANLLNMALPLAGEALSAIPAIGSGIGSALSGLTHLFHGSSDPQRFAKMYFKADGAFLTKGGPNWMDYSFAGSGPNRQDWSTTSEDYVEEHERPRHNETWMTDCDGDVTVYNERLPQQKKSSRRQAGDLVQGPLPSYPPGKMFNRPGEEEMYRLKYMNDPRQHGGPDSAEWFQDYSNAEQKWLDAFRAEHPTPDDDADGYDDKDVTVYNERLPQQKKSRQVRANGDFAGSGDAGYGSLGGVSSGHLSAGGSGQGLGHGGFESAAEQSGGHTVGELGNIKDAALLYEADAFHPSEVGAFNPNNPRNLPYDKGDTGLGEDEPEEKKNDSDGDGKKGGPSAGKSITDALKGGGGEAGAGEAAAGGGEAAGLGELAELAPLVLAASLDDSDVVRRFHASGGGFLDDPANSDDGIAAAAQKMLRTAGRNYTPAEQRELENESHPKGARNLGSLDLRGTHYEDE